METIELNTVKPPRFSNMEEKKGKPLSHLTREEEIDILKASLRDIEEGKVWSTDELEKTNERMVGWKRN